MLRINLASEPRWIDLGHGVRIEVIPLTSGLVAAANADPAMTEMDQNTPPDVRWQGFVKSVGRLCIRNWEGVADHTGEPIAVTSEGVNALLDLYQMSRAFAASFISPTLLLVEEKKGFAPLSNGSSAGALNTAKPAHHSAKGASVN